MKTTSASLHPTSERFEILRPLGEGATGAVFLAIDRETAEQVALKKLFRIDQKSVARFKREFRSLADISHPNLVKLYDLQRVQGTWFLTMEYIAGRDFRQKFTDYSPEASNDNGSAELLRVFHDLACGVSAIHRAGMLHRDLKPSNALVSDTGRVVVLDFGLVRDIDGGNPLTQDGTIAGTPAYMPPEQATGDNLTEASDWYAFGAMLYEAISGTLPIEGRTVSALIERKLSTDPLPLSTGAPNEVLKLCNGLVEREARRRPTGRQVLEVLAAASGRSSARPATHEQLTIEPAPIAPAASLFGRDAELAQLKAAFQQHARQNSLVLHVRGASGSGKSALVERFLEDTIETELDPPVVLRSRCYEREAIPFKALDGVMDALVTHLSAYDDVRCAHLMPANISELARLFPALERLGAVQRLRAARQRGDETQIRRRAEHALRSLLTSIATQRRLLVWIDDLQWGDLDSAGVLRDWLDQPLPAPVLVVLSYRSEELASSPALALLQDRPKQSSIDLAPLRASDIRLLCRHRLSQISIPPEVMIERIVAESQGNPFLAQQLTAIAEAKLARQDFTLDGLSMEALVQRASMYLDESARALLNVLAVAGKPIGPRLALDAANVSSAGRAHIHSLRGLRLLRARDVGGERLLEVYHDRVRETVQASLSAQESESIHAALLQALEGNDDHAWLHTLALGAQNRAAAFNHGLLAAEHASKILAFERAAELFRNCLSLFDGELELYVLWMKLAAAEAHCRRGHEAAKAYSRAAHHAPAAQRGELLRLAAAHLVRSGRFEEGECVVQDVLATNRMRVPSTSAGMIAAIGWERGRIALRSLDVPPGRTAPLHKDRADAAILYGTLSAETQLYAPLRSALFQARALRIALDYGSPTQIARALVLTAAVACLSGTERAAQHSQEQLDRAEQLYKRTGDPETQLELLCARAVCAHFVGDVSAALDPAVAVERLLENRATSASHGDYYYKFTASMVQISCLQNLGRLLEARKALHEHVAYARATDNLAAVLQVTVNQTVDEQALDMCTGSRARLDAEYAQLPKGNVNILSTGHMLSVMRTACVTRDYEWAFTRLAELWAPFLRSVVHGSALVASLAHTLHARLLINRQVEAHQTGDLESLVRSDLKQLARLPAGLMPEIAIARLRARLAVLAGKPETAMELLRRCIDSAAAAKNSVRQDLEHDRYALGLLVRGEEGSELVSTARSNLADYGINDPDANMLAYVPELMRR